jgi:uncharacterized protein
VEDKKAIMKTAAYVEKRFNREGSGHDWWHVKRVVQLSKQIAKKEKCDTFIVEMAALMHDLDDWKFAKEGVLPSHRARKLMEGLGIDANRISSICYVIDNVSFKGGFGRRMKTIEGSIVQDADRIDALGAIGIARVFAYNGYKRRLIYDPNVKPMKYKDEQDYKKRNARSNAINHFYEKLFLLEGRMNTKTGRKIAVERTKYMKEHLKRFMKEWRGTE